MSEQNKSDDKSSQATSGIAIVALLLGLFAAQDTILNPTRPTMTNLEKAVTEDVRSRLWQDPFLAVEQHRKHHTDTETEKVKSFDTYQIEKESVQKICPPQKQPENNKTKTTAHSIEELGCQIDRKISNGKSPHVLAVMVPGGPYAENQEWRLRSRYALIAGLSASGYSPVDPEHIGFVDFEKACRNAAEQTDHSKSYLCDFPPYMPYEWFEPSLFKKMPYPDNPKSPETPSDQDQPVLVLWLNNDAFAQEQIHTLETLNRLNDGLKETTRTDSQTKAIFTIIGPHDSHTLKKMYGEAETLLTKNLLEDNLIFSPFATISPEQLKQSNKTASVSPKALEQLNNKIIRTTSTNDSLASTLLCELSLRGVTPYHYKSQFTEKDCKNLSGFVLGKPDQPHHIVLINELDTLYSQSLTDAILKKINPGNHVPVPVHTFNYLRGLDGITTANASTGQAAKDKAKGSQTDKPSDKEIKEQRERPIGPSQLDYLLNLAEELKRLDKHYAAAGGIKAIGITGSDAYDKLLILQALRNKLPGKLFFTTDLDARLFHPSELKWTRNLIVASPFGLKNWEIESENKRIAPQTGPKVPNQNSPNASSQNGYHPSFRDSYQTSLYLSTRLALLCNPKFDCAQFARYRADTWWINRPWLFEIGNYGAVDISHEPHFLPDRHDRDSRLQSAAFVFLGIIFLTGIFKYFTPQKLRVRLYAIASASILLVFFYIYLLLADDLGTEPVSFTDGTSTWPANGIRILAILLTLYFFLHIRNQLIDSKEAIEKEFKSPEGNKTAGNITNLWSQTAEILIGFAGTIKISCKLLIRLIVNSLNQKQRAQLVQRFSIDYWETDTSQNKPVRFEKLWDQYLIRRNYTLIRILPIAVLFILFIIYIALKIGDFPPAPFRGEFNFVSNYCIISIAAMLYLFLILYIADNVHLSSHFIRLLAGHSIVWPSGLVKTYKNKYDLPEHAIKHKILLDFIKQHTDVPNKFIYYPFFCLFLIIISRNYYFDNWPTTPAILFIYVFFALVTLISAIRLRAAAQYARRHVLDELSMHSAQPLVNESWHRRRDNAIKLKSLISEIADFKEGIFKPLLHHPMLLSLLMPLSSIGGVFLIEYLT